LTEKPKVKIKLKSFVADLKNGMDDKSLVEKHGITEAMLPKVIEQLIAAGHLTEEEAASRSIFDSTQKVAALFSFPFDTDGKD
jgi:hypothetical protein